jgi:hypothetical protein
MYICVCVCVCVCASVRACVQARGHVKTLTFIAQPCWQTSKNLIRKTEGGGCSGGISKRQQIEVLKGLPAGHGGYVSLNVFRCMPQLFLVITFSIRRQSVQPLGLHIHSYRRQIGKYTPSTHCLQYIHYPHRVTSYKALHNKVVVTHVLHLRTYPCRSSQGV